MLRVVEELSDSEVAHDVLAAQTRTSRRLCSLDTLPRFSRGYPSFASEDRGGLFGRLDRRRLGSGKALCGAREEHRA